jgi:hypothetical protein
MARPNARAVHDRASQPRSAADAFKALVSAYERGDFREARLWIRELRALRWSVVRLAPREIPYP